MAKKEGADLYSKCIGIIALPSFAVLLGLLAYIAAVPPLKNKFNKKQCLIRVLPIVVLQYCFFAIDTVWMWLRTASESWIRRSSDTSDAIKWHADISSKSADI